MRGLNWEISKIIQIYTPQPPFNKNNLPVLQHHLSWFFVGGIEPVGGVTPHSSRDDIPNIDKLCPSLLVLQPVKHLSSIFEVGCVFFNIFGKHKNNICSSNIFLLAKRQQVTSKIPAGEGKSCCKHFLGLLKTSSQQRGAWRISNLLRKMIRISHHWRRLKYITNSYLPNAATEPFCAAWWSDIESWPMLHTVPSTPWCARLSWRTSSRGSTSRCWSSCWWTTSGRGPASCSKF